MIFGFSFPFPFFSSLLSTKWGRIGRRSDEERKKKGLSQGELGEK